MPEFVDDLHAKNMKYVPMLDAGISARKDSDYPYYDEGLKKNVFLKINGEPFIGMVWPNDAAFPDYFNPETVKWWQNGVQDLFDQIHFDGLWEDMNEASNFCHGACYSRQWVESPVR